MYRDACEFIGLLLSKLAQNRISIVAISFVTYAHFMIYVWTKHNLIDTANIWTTGGPVY